MILNLDEMKGYLRVDFNDDDEVILHFIEVAETLCADIARISVDEFSKMPTSKIAVMYAVAYLYEHREDADHHRLTISLRSLFEGVRRSGLKKEMIVLLMIILQRRRIGPMSRFSTS